jgi:hypothetical protein
MKIQKLLLLITVIGTLLLSVAWGQTSGTLSGKITAADGSPVPNASVMITDSTGFARSTVGAQDGTFTIQNLPPGTYRVQVEAAGFKRLSQENVQVMAGTPISLQLGMEAGSNSETVEVAGHAPLAQDQDAQIAHSYAGRILSELPVLDLNHEQLVELMPGITPPAASTSILVDPQRSRTWNTNGQAAQSNNILLDGVENLEPVNNIAVHIPTINDIQQMNLTTSNYPAEEGRALGSILFPLSRPGTNAWHGDAFEYHNDSWLKARNYFDPSGLPQPVSAMNQFGGAVGGAIVPDKTFLFLSDEGDLNRDATPTYTTVPGTAFAMGNFSSLPAGNLIYNPFSATTAAGRTAFANNTITPSLINPASEAILSALPQPNLSGFENNYFANVPFRNYGLRTEARVDQHFDDNNLLFMRYALSYFTTSQQSALGALGADAGDSRLRAHDALIGYTHAFGATTFTDIRVGYTRYSDPIYALNSAGLASAYGLTHLSGELPAISIDGMQAIGTNATYPQTNKEDTWNGANNWTMRIGNNDLRFGLDYWQIRADGFQNLLYGPAGGYTFSAGATSLPSSTLGPFASYANSLAAFLLGTPSVAGVASSNYLPSYISRQYGAYVSDHINIMSHLSLDLGLRYDYFWPIEPRSNAASYSVYQPGTNTLAPLGTNGISRYGGVNSNNLNFAPRIGMAYRVNDRTVVRAGYGITYWNPDLPFFASSLIPSTVGLDKGTTSGYGIGGTFGVLPAMTTGTTATNQTYYVTPSRVRTPYLQFYNFDVQQDVTHGILFDIAYVGNLGRELPYTQDLNAALPGAGSAGQAFSASGQTSPVYLRGTGYNSNYNALQVNITKRFSQGIAFTAAYTWSKSLDYGAGLTPFLNNNNPVANYGPSNFNRPQVFTFTHNWQLPFGTGRQYLHDGVVGRILGPWELDGILRYASGLPFTPTASAAQCMCPGNTPTANVTQGPGYYGFYPSYFGYLVPYYFTSYSFTQPAAGSLGNVGRNSLQGPDFWNYDLALSRHFVIAEGIRLEVRAEGYNLSNSVHFGAPVANVNSPLFGESTATAPGLGARTFQFALKLVF